MNARIAHELINLGHDLAYETADGEHTLSMCGCMRGPRRRSRCIECIKEEMMKLLQQTTNEDTA